MNRVDQAVRDAAIGEAAALREMSRVSVERAEPESHSPMGTEGLEDPSEIDKLIAVEARYFLPLDYSKYGELSRLSQELFDALAALEKESDPRALDLSRLDAMTPTDELAQLILYCKATCQRLYSLGSGRSDQLQDQLIVLVMQVDLAIRVIVAEASDDSTGLRALVESFSRLQGLTMQLERFRSHESP